MKRTFLALVTSLAAISLAWAQTYRDSSGTKVDGVVQAGSFGKDFSANTPTPPNIGANFAATGPYASYFLVTTISSDPSRKSIDVENVSGSQIAIVLDDGTAANGSAPVNATVFALAGGAGVGQQGGSWVSLVERGRVQIYAPSASAQVAVRVN